ncbi:GrpB family protein [Streptomyces sp. NPDC056690]|uniref:GrpB family protein n=1 Tax=unclassified Streptomyces TaxID=2593676 RepID=UPI003630A236
MPFPDEIGPVMVLDHRPQWPPEFEQLAGQLRAAMGGVALDIDHVGSTAVPGLAAKDCIDVQIRVRSIDEGGAFKQRPAASVSDLCEYGQIKAPATEVLMAGAERWAAETAWTVTRQSPPGSA